MFAGRAGRRRRGGGTNEYMLVGAVVARRLQRSRKQFTSHDIVDEPRLRPVMNSIAKRGGGVIKPTAAVRAWAGEWLDGVARAGQDSSQGVTELVQRCPQLVGKAKKLWKGY